MPLYEYACQSCGCEFEFLVRNGSSPACPTCGDSQLERRLSVPAAHTGSSKSLPICETPRGQTCGLPQCGMGGCQSL